MHRLRSPNLYDLNNDHYAGAKITFLSRSKLRQLIISVSLHILKFLISLVVGVHINYSVSGHNPSRISGYVIPTNYSYRKTSNRSRVSNYGGPQMTRFIQNISLHSHSTSTLLPLYSCFYKAVGWKWSESRVKSCAWSMHDCHLWATVLDRSLVSGTSRLSVPTYDNL